MRSFYLLSSLLIAICFTTINAQEVDSTFNRYKVRVHTNEIPDSLIINGKFYKLTEEELLISVPWYEKYEIRATKKGYQLKSYELSKLKLHKINRLTLEFKNVSTIWHKGAKSISSWADGQERYSAPIYESKFGLHFSAGMSFWDVSFGDEVDGGNTHQKEMYAIRLGYTFDRITFDISYISGQMYSNELYGISREHEFSHEAYQFNVMLQIIRFYNFGLGLGAGFQWMDQKEIEYDWWFNHWSNFPPRYRSVTIQYENTGFIPGFYFIWRPLPYVSTELRGQYSGNFKTTYGDLSKSLSGMIYTLTLNAHL